MRAPIKPRRADRERQEPGASRREPDLTALLGAFCFFLSAVEYMVPKPLPFMRLGIANLPILLAVDLLPLPWYLALALVKVLGMSLVSGSLFSYIAVFSLAGTLTAALAMRATRRALGGRVSAVGLSVLGAMASNAVQVAVAGAFVFGEAARLMAPPFLAMGLVTGLLLGLFAEAFAAKSKWYERARQSLGAGRARGSGGVRD
jgi:heptaprenyl diphosphate synthase